MADFKQAYLLTGHNEGGYANNNSDHGGETFAGIARNFWPAWSGWGMIDAYKHVHTNDLSGINTSMFANPTMQLYISNFYKNNFWDANKLDLINDQQVANNVYDFGVNSGVSKAAKTLQLVVGVSMDGIIGKATIGSVNSKNGNSVYDNYNNERISFYHTLASNPGQLQFLKSWMSRIKPYKL